MNQITGDRAEVLANIRRLLDDSRWFPEYVFRDQWSHLFFFDSDWMFDAKFVEQAQALLQIDGGRCVCIANFDRTVRTDDRLFFIDHHTTPDAYRDVLYGEHPGEGWFNDVGRFGCCSAANDWCLYSERACEIAVIGIRSAAQVERIRPILAQFYAAPLADTLADPPSYGFEALSPHWRAELLEHYG